MPAIPHSLRLAKHGLFQFLPGRIGLRNRACLHHLTKRRADALFRRALDEVTSGDILIDCGANVGSVSRVLAGRGVPVHAFEPDPWSFRQLSQNLAGFPNAVLHNQAVSVRDGQITFYRDQDFDSDPGRLSLSSSVNRRPGTEQVSVEVPVVDLPAFIERLGAPIGLLKLDIEGAEVDLLERLFDSPMLARIRYIFVETHELQFPDLLERTAALRARAARIAPTVVNLDWH